MAIYYLNVKPVSRSAGRSATGSAAYRCGVAIFCERRGELHDYTRRSGVVHSEILMPANAPVWANDRSKLWNAAESSEKRKDSTVAREYIVALPKELTPEQRRELVREFANELIERHGVAVDLAIHAPGRGDINEHAHVLTSTRRLGPDGFTEKSRELDAKETGSKEVERWRERWADLTNKALERAGQSARVDHRTLVAQRIEALALGDMVRAEALDREPTRHLGPAAADDLRRFQQGKKPELATDRAREHLQIKADNDERQSLLRQVRQLREVREVIKWGIDQPQPSQALQLARKWSEKLAMRAPAAEPEPELELEAMRAPAAAAEPGRDLTPTQQQETHERSSPPNYLEVARARAPSGITNMPRLSTRNSVFDKNPRRICNGHSIFDKQVRRTSQKSDASGRKNTLQTSAHVHVRKLAEKHHARLHRARGQVSSSTVVETALDLERMRVPEQGMFATLRAQFRRIISIFGAKPIGDKPAMQVPESAAEPVLERIAPAPEPAAELEVMRVREPAAELELEWGETALERAIAPAPAVELEAIRVPAAELGLEPRLTAQAAATRVTGLELAMALPEPERMRVPPRELTALEKATLPPPVVVDDDDDLRQKM